jgi:hypothetical protein
MSAKPAAFGARPRRFEGEMLAPKTHIAAAIRVDSEAAKTNHRRGAAAARESPVRRPSRDWPARAAELRPDG